MITKRIEEMRKKCRDGGYTGYRKTSPDYPRIKAAMAQMNVYEANAYMFRKMLEAETPVIIPSERLQYTRTIIGTIPVLVDKVVSERNGNCPVWSAENMSPDYAVLLACGLENRLNMIRQELKKVTPESEEHRFLFHLGAMTEDALAFADRYADAALQAGETELSALLRKVPRHPAETLQEALQSIYFYHALMRLAPYIHLGFGRFDQYMLKYYRRDIAEGMETRESARELIAEFFLALNRDSDLYHGVQKGDNGQSMVLGGCNRDGSPAENELTTLVMDISADLKVIEPKINLRVNSGTSKACLASAINLSGCGLGFPQYNNDEVIIPALVKFGYPLEDARDYIVAACWEFVVPNGRDVPNVDAVNIAYAADNAIRYVLKNHLPFEEIYHRVRLEFREIIQKIQSKWKTRKHLPGPLFSLLNDRCITNHVDLNVAGQDHYHYGLHGSGSSTGADSIAAVKHFVYDSGKYSCDEFLEALEHNFEGYESLQQELKNCPYKVGCNNEDADFALKTLFDIFADSCAEIKDNGRGGKVRPGSGSAQFYVLLTQDPNRFQYLHATADGRREGEFISSSLAPAPGVRANGMLSVLASYRQIDYSRICNGGPLTMEFDPVCFSSDSAKERMGELITAFIHSGCQQLQWNVLNREVLLHAQKYPEQHKDLVVRVWGWSGYFVELEKHYQDQIIGRTSYRG